MPRPIVLPSCLDASSPLLHNISFLSFSMCVCVCVHSIGYTISGALALQLDAATSGPDTIRPPPTLQSSAAARVPVSLILPFTFSFFFFFYKSSKHIYICIYIHACVLTHTQTHREKALGITRSPAIRLGSIEILYMLYTTTKRSIYIMVGAWFTGSAWWRIYRYIEYIRKWRAWLGRLRLRLGRH